MNSLTFGIFIVAMSPVFALVSKDLPTKSADDYVGIAGGANALGSVGDFIGNHFSSPYRSTGSYRADEGSHRSNTQTITAGAPVTAPPFISPWNAIKDLQSASQSGQWWKPVAGGPIPGNGQHMYPGNYKMPLGMNR